MSKANRLQLLKVRFATLASLCVSTQAPAATFHPTPRVTVLMSRAGLPAGR
jgi:hypothetical protein